VHSSQIDLEAKMTKFTFLPILLLVLAISSCFGQQAEKLSFVDTPDTLNKKRALTVGITAATLYTGSLITVNEFWYKDFPRTSFQTFNDWGEWENMDKYGHAFSAYSETKLFYHASRWTGLSSKNSALAAVAFSTLAQTSIEVLDGHSAQWGWSWFDVAYNTGGTLLFGVQQYVWDEQKIKMKFSYTPINYSTSPITNNNQTSTILDRAEESFGTGPAERILKDYNAQTIWLSLNLKSVLANNNQKFPSWLNLAVGYGAENALGAFGNGWVRNGERFVPTDFQRHQQLFFSFDIDLEKLPVRNKALRGLCKILNIIKIPSPTMEFNTLGERKFHWLYF